MNYLLKLDSFFVVCNADSIGIFWKSWVNDQSNFFTVGAELFHDIGGFFKVESDAVDVLRFIAWKFGGKTNTERYRFGIVFRLNGCCDALTFSIKERNPKTIYLFTRCEGKIPRIGFAVFLPQAKGYAFFFNLLIDLRW